MKCPNCGKETTDNSKFCMHCGALTQGGVPIQVAPIVPTKQKKSWYKKWWIWVIIVAIYLIVLGSISSIFPKNSSDDVPDSSLAAELDNSMPENIKEETITPLEFDTGEIYNGHNCKISVKNGNESSLSFVLANNSKKDYSFSLHSCSINGIMTDCNPYTIHTDVPSKKKANVTLEFEDEWLENIDDIKYIELIFWVYSDNFKSYDTGVLRIKTNKYDTKSYIVEGSQKQTTEGLSISLLDIADNKIKVSVVNNNDYYIDYNLENMSINGWAYDTFIDVYNIELYAHSQSIFTLKVDDDFFEENSVDKIKNCEFDLEIRRNGDYFEKSNTKKIKFKK